MRNSGFINIGYGNIVASHKDYSNNDRPKERDRKNPRTDTEHRIRSL